MQTPAMEELSDLAIKASAPGVLRLARAIMTWELQFSWRNQISQPWARFSHHRYTYSGAFHIDGCLMPRWLNIKARLIDQLHIRFCKTNCLNPVTFLSGDDAEEPIHECLELTTFLQGYQPVLTNIPLQDPEMVFVLYWWERLHGKWSDTQKQSGKRPEYNLGSGLSSGTINSKSQTNDPYAGSKTIQGQNNKHKHCSCAWG